jgi:hypothetical protein
MMRTSYFGLTLAAAAAGLVNASCSTVECGQGTVERDGACFAADQSTEPGMCGGTGPFATVLGLDGTCETEVPTVCDEETTRAETDDQTGVTTCIGTGGGCEVEIQCSAPESGRITLCGRIWDAETDMPIAASIDGSTAECDPAAPTTSGPCSLRVRFFDALDFAGDPAGAMAITPPDGVYTDNCNRYRGHNMTRPQFGFIGMGVDDAPGITPTTPHRLTGVATANALATPGRGFRAYSTRVSTDMLWSTSAAIGGMTFAERGVLAIVFRYQGQPRAGVQIRQAGSLIPNTDFYFTDTGIARTSVSPGVPGTQSVTGANGTGLVISVDTPTAHDGVGAEPGTPGQCIWPSNLAAAIPGVVFIQTKDAETTLGAACP